MTGRALRVVAAGQDRRLAHATVARLLDGGPDGAHAAVIARGTAGTHPRLLANTAGETTLLWRDRAHRLRRHPDLVRRGAAEVFCLAPRASLMRVARRDGAARREEIATGDEVPERLFAADGALFAVYRAGNDDRTIAALQVTGSGGVAVGERLPLPPMDGASTISALARDRAGRIVLTADNPVTGFKLWRRAPGGGWTLEIADGAARFGINAVVHDLAVWDDLVALAVGGNHPPLARQSGLRFPGEIIVLRADGSHAILCGEARISASGLMTPLAGQANAAAREQGLFTRLASDGEALLAVMQRAADATVYRIGPGFEITVAGEVEGIVADLAVAPESGAPVTVLVLGGTRPSERAPVPPTTPAGAVPE